jgi:hypothetical protein
MEVVEEGARRKTRRKRTRPTVSASAIAKPYASN